jgi:hypothetical protein
MSARYQSGYVTSTVSRCVRFTDAVGDLFESPMSPPDQPHKAPDIAEQKGQNGSLAKQGDYLTDNPSATFLKGCI